MIVNDQTWYLGIDWGRERHQACIVDDQSKSLANRSFEHSASGLQQLIEWCLNTVNNTPASVSVAIEVPHGPVVDTLQRQGFEVFSINPKQLDRFRDRYHVAGAKDDRRDARVLASALRTDPQAFRWVSPIGEQNNRLRPVVRMRDQLTSQRVRLSNQFQNLLWSYFPQFLLLNGDLTKPWVLALWELIPSPKKAKRVSLKRVERLLRDHRIRRIDADSVLSLLRQPPLDLTPHIVEDLVESIEPLIEQLELVNQQIASAEKKLQTRLQEIDQNFQQRNNSSQTFSDVAILQSFPGVGLIVLSILLGEASEAVQRKDYRALRCLCGVAPAALCTQIET